MDHEIPSEKLDFVNDHTWNYHGPCMELAWTCSELFVCSGSDFNFTEVFNEIISGVEYSAEPFDKLVLLSHRSKKLPNGLQGGFVWVTRCGDNRWLIKSNSSDFPICML